MVKFYDTCSLLSDYQNIFKSGQFFLISSITLNELESIKTSGHKDEETKYNARKVLHCLNDNPLLYQVILYKETYFKNIQKLDFEENNDSKIIATALYLNTKEELYKNKIFFITKDLACKELAIAVGLNVNYLEDNLNQYCGYYEYIAETETDLADFYSNILPAKLNIFKLYNNEYLIIKNDVGTIIDKYKWTKEEGYSKIPFYKAESKMFGKITPFENDEYQQLALDSLFTNKLTMIRGAAGTGKSYLSFGYMFYLLEKGLIDKIIIFCNTVATKGSAKLGFYPGSRDEKLLDSQIGNLLSSKLGDKTEVEKMIDNGTIVLLPMSDIRGYDTSGMNAAIYITEAQNLDIDLMKLALQRVGEDSICILDGDSDTQVDLSQYSGNNNGMRRVSEVFKGQSFYGEVTLKNIHRSKIAEIAQLM